MKESKFTTEIVNSFNEQKCWAYKIPDSPPNPMFRFTVEKPCDIIVCSRGLLLGVETKLFKDFEAFGLRHLRQSQIDNLDQIINRGLGRSFVFLNIRISGNKAEGIKHANRCLIFDWAKIRDRLKSGDSIKQKELMSWPYIEGKRNRFDLSRFIEKHG